jgi:hypothetical protein
MPVTAPALQRTASQGLQRVEDAREASHLPPFDID